MKLRRVLLALLAAVVMLVAPVKMPVVYAASGPDVDYHTQDQIREYINSSGVSLSDQVEFKTEPVKPNVRGELSDSCKNKALKMLNNFRYIAGLDAVRLDTSQGNLAQAAAFADMVLNTLTHTPDTTYDSNNNEVPVPKPAGMSDKDWADANEGGRSSNIAWGYSSMNESIYGWTTDGDSDNIERVGHRRWLLNPEMGTTGFGCAGAYSAMYSMDYSNTSASQSSVAWPAQNMPVDFFDSNLPWTFSTGTILNRNNIRVTLTRLNDNKVWNFSGTQTYSTDDDKYFNVENNGYGQAGCIIFRPDGIDAYRDGDQFRVDITGAGSTISYNVNFFSMVPMTGIEFSRDPVSVLYGETKTVYLDVVPSNASDSIDESKVTYTIDDTSIATVDSNGKITAKKIGQTKITAKYKDFTTTADLFVAKSIDDCSISPQSFYVEFTGSPVMPKFTVKDGDYTLVEGVDYEVIPFYENNDATYPGDSGYATVKGKGKYSGEPNIGYKFIVIAKSITQDMVTLSDSSFVYDGKDHSPDAVIKYNGMTLVEGTDYTITKATGTNAGSYSHTIKGIGNYKGTYNAPFRISKLTLTEDMFTVDDSGLVYNGKNQTPEVTGKAGNLDLAEDVHYTISFDPAVNAGEYEAVVTGKGNCEGDLNFTFKIQKAEYPPKKPSECTVSYSTYTLDNDLLCFSEGWEFDSADIGKELQVGDDNVFTAYYVAADKDNYKITSTEFIIRREECDHMYSPDKIVGKKDPDCENDGYTGDIYCNDCGEFLEKGKTIPALGHRYGAPEYTWSDDNKTATASMVCANDETHIVSETVETTYKVTKKPDCENKGIGTYTAAFKNKAFTGQTKDVEIEALGHAYGAPEYEWSDNNRVVTASMVCANDNSHVISEKVKTVYKVTKAPGCETKGTGTYTALFSNKSFATQTKTVEIEALGHKMTYHKAADASCTEAGNIEYWQCDNCHQYWSEEERLNELAREEIVIPKLGHDWSEWKTVAEPTDEKEGLETRECSRCHSVEEKRIPRKEVTPAENPANGSAAENVADASAMNGADGTPLGKGASIKAAEKAITSMPNDKDPAGTEYGTLFLKSGKQAKTSVTLSWKSVPGAAGYYIFGNKCGKSNRMTLQKIAKGTSLKVTKILGNNNQLTKVKKGTYYKFIAVAVDGNGRVLSTSKVIHISTKGGKTGNYKTVKTRAVKNKVTLKKGKKFKLAGKGVAQSAKLKVRKHRGIAYETSNPAVAKVTSKGVIKGTGKGKCYVYAYSQSGTFEKIKVAVK